eukprot:753670-Hanusia_phi.AAC.1
MHQHSIVDVFFVLEVVLHGLTGERGRSEVADGEGGAGADVHGEIVHELSTSLRVWARQNLVVDVLASVPMAWIEFFAVPGEQDRDMESEDGGW